MTMTNAVNPVPAPAPASTPASTPVTNKETKPKKRPWSDSLSLVFEAAYEQATCGKGLQRHGQPGQPFEDQPVMLITKQLGLGFPLGQAVKKILESQRLNYPSAINELLGAMVYLAAAVLYYKGFYSDSATVADIVKQLEDGLVEKGGLRR